MLETVKLLWTIPDDSNISKQLSNCKTIDISE